MTCKYVALAASLTLIASCAPTRAHTPRAEGVALRESAPPPGAPVTVVHVRGARWSWTFGYETDWHAVDVLHAPVGRWIHLRFESADVEHRFEVPELGLRVDIPAGGLVERWVRVERGGRFTTVCSRQCPDPARGTFTAELRFVSEEEYEAVLASAGRPLGYSDARWGEELARTRGCVACHTHQQPSGVGPSFASMAAPSRVLEDGTTVDATGEDGTAYLRESVVAPSARIVAGFPPVMPTYTLPAPEVDALLAYLGCFGERACETSPECRELPPCQAP